MAFSKMPFLSAMQLRNSFRFQELRLKSDNTASTPTPSKQSQETRPKKPQTPFMRFQKDKMSKIMSELHKEGAKRWTDISEEAKRPYVEKYEADIENWKAEKAQMKAQFKAMQEEDKEKSSYSGRHLFFSEVQIPGATASNFTTKAGQMWNDLTPEEREAYHERARQINEKGQGDLLAATMKKINSYGRPLTASMQFSSSFLSDKLKEAYKEMKREWSELSDEEKGKYVKQYEEETKLFNDQMEEYRAGDNYAGNTRKRNVLRAKIKEIEEELSKPKFISFSCWRIKNL